MATGFPAQLDTFVNPLSSDKLAAVSHADQHADANDAIEALQRKVGIDNSSDAASLDNRLNALETAVETDPVFIASAAFGIAAADLSNWNSAYGWGNHAEAGYSLNTHDHNTSYYTQTQLQSSGLASVHWNNITNHPAVFTPDAHTHIGSDITSQVADADTLDGNHANAFAVSDHNHTGVYLESETDPVFNASAAKNIASEDISNWNTAFGWGDHSQVGYGLLASNNVWGGTNEYLETIISDGTSFLTVADVNDTLYGFSCARKYGDESAVKAAPATWGGSTFTESLLRSDLVWGQGDHYYISSPNLDDTYAAFLFSCTLPSWVAPVNLSALRVHYDGSYSVTGNEGFAIYVWNTTTQLWDFVSETTVYERHEFIADTSSLGVDGRNYLDADKKVHFLVCTRAAAGQPSGMLACYALRLSFAMNVAIKDQTWFGPMQVKGDVVFDKVGITRSPLYNLDASNSSARFGRFIASDSSDARLPTPTFNGYPPVDFSQIMVDYGSSAYSVALKVQNAGATTSSIGLSSRCESSVKNTLVGITSYAYRSGGCGGDAAGVESSVSTFMCMLQNTKSIAFQAKGVTGGLLNAAYYADTRNATSSQSVWDLLMVTGHTNLLADLYLGNANSSGLQAELVSDYGFSNSSAWACGAGWSISGGYAVRQSGASSTYLDPVIPVTPVPGRVYCVVVNMSAYTSGYIEILLGGRTLRIPSSTSTYTFYVTATTSDNLRVYAYSTSVLSLNSLSVKEVGVSNLYVGKGSVKFGNNTVAISSKLSGDLDLDATSHINLNNNTVVSGSLAATGFQANGSAGLSTTVTITDNLGVTHSLTYTGGILTGYSTV